MGTLLGSRPPEWPKAPLPGITGWVRSSCMKTFVSDGVRAGTPWDSDSSLNRQCGLSMIQDIKLKSEIPSQRLLMENLLKELR
jgi:hypothetical protein